MKKEIILICIALFIAAACNYPLTRKQYLKGFDKLVSNVEKDYTNNKEKDWKKSDSIYNLYTGKYYDHYREDLTKEEVHKIGEFKGRYQTIKAKYYFLKGTDKVKDFIEEANGFFEGVGEEMKSNGDND